LEFTVPRNIDPEPVILSKIDEMNLRDRATKAARGRYWYEQRKFIEIISMGDGEGIDRWGRFYALTGFEEQGKCFWCGDPAKYRYCSSNHRGLYTKHFHWRQAKQWCYERFGEICVLCGIEKKYKIIDAYDQSYYSSIDKLVIEIHHIIPLKGTERVWSILNHPDNLIPLCSSCHISVHYKIDLIEFLRD